MGYSSTQTLSKETSPSLQVIEIIAARDGTDPRELPVLNDTIDTEALDRLFEGDARLAGAISFRYCGYGVTVSANGEISVTE